MPQTYAEIVAQIETLQAEAEAARAREVPDVIERIRGAIAQFGLKASDLGFAGGSRPAAKRSRQASGANGMAIPTVVARKASKPAPKPKSKMPPKYRDGDNTWTGRGLKPRWLQAALAKGGKVEDFLIAK